MGMNSKEIVKALRRGLFSNLLLELAANKIEELENKLTKVKCGYWKGYLAGQHIMPERYYECSICGSDGWKYRHKYCPDCGARMKLNTQ